MAGFHLHQYPLCLACIVIYKGDHPIYAFIAPFLTLSASLLSSKWPGAYKRKGPPLELITVSLGKLAGRAYVFRLSYNLKLNAWKPCSKAAFFECNAQG